MPLTPRHLAILRAIEADTFVVRRGPTMRQIGEAEPVSSPATQVSLEQPELFEDEVEGCADSMPEQPEMAVAGTETAE